MELTMLSLKNLNNLLVTNRLLSGTLCLGLWLPSLLDMGLQAYREDTL